MNREQGLPIVAGIVFLVLLALLAQADIPGQPSYAFGLYAGAFCLLWLLTFRWLPAGPDCLRSTLFIVVAGILLRLAFLPFPASDDVNRYIWEGHLVANQVNPYLEPPAAYPERAGDPIYDGINHPDFPAAYPPLILLIFGGISHVAYGADTPPAHTLLAFKFFALVVDVAVVLLLVPLLRAWRRPAHWLALYAWNPLVLLYGVGEGHLDVVQNLFLVLALLAFFRPRERGGAGFLALGCAAMTKYLSVVLVPFLLNRRNLRWLPLLLVPFLAYLPFLDAGIFASVTRFAGELHANDLVPRLLRMVLSGTPYRLAMVVVLGAGLGIVWLLKQEAPARSLILAWGWLICCLPTVHPWYLLPMCILLLHTPVRAWYVLMVTMGAQFWILHGQRITGHWIEFPWIWPVMYGPFLLVLLYDLTRHRQPWLTRYPLPDKVDILIPTLNEGANLERCLSSIRTAIEQAADVHFELIVIDGGSEDATLEIARRHDCRVLEAERLGRGNQYAQGIREGSGELILMLHADAVMTPDALAKLMFDCRRHPTVEWGVLGHVYDQRTWRMRLIELSNRLRFNLGGVAFGDQGIFVRREVLARAGGMPEVPLMEDVELSLRLADAPYRLQIGSSLEVSTRTWETKSYTGYTLQVLRLVTTYLVRRRLGTDIPALCADMYRQYYGREPGR